MVLLMFDTLFVYIKQCHINMVYLKKVTTFYTELMNVFIYSFQIDAIIIPNLSPNW